jgi:parvulin-like peptidyl-prolyl cis-trans isomerase-like protein
MAEPDRIAIQHILVSFEGTPTESTRSRADAESLAKQLFDQARETEEFAELVRKHSDDPLQPDDPQPGVYNLLNNNVEGATFAEFVTELNSRAAAKEAELVEVMKGGSITQEQVEEQMNEFLDGLRAEGDSKVRNLPHPRAAMVPAFGDVGFALEVGEVGMAEYDDAASPFGWHIIKRIS